MNFGYKENPIESDHYLAGTIPNEILQSDMNWEAFLPSPEDQRKKIETSNCPSFGTLHCAQTYLDRKFGIRDDYSDRAVGIASGNVGEGCDPHVVAETIRKIPCVIPESMLPFGDEIDAIQKYYSPNPLSQDIQNRGAEWLRRFNFQHEWVLTKFVPDRQEILREWIKHSPLGVAVNNWRKNEQGLYVKSDGEPNVHWCELYRIDGDGRYHVFDQYPPYKKVLAPDFAFTRAKRYFVERKPDMMLAPQRHFSFAEFFMNYFKILFA